MRRDGTHCYLAGFGTTGVGHWRQMVDKQGVYKDGHTGGEFVCAFNRSSSVKTIKQNDENRFHRSCPLCPYCASSHFQGLWYVIVFKSSLICCSN